MKVTSPHSFILFRPLSRKRALYRGVSGGPKWATMVKTCPWDHFPTCKKETIP